jgi:hypothetical protein
MLATDLTVRAKILDYVSNTQVSYLDYTIRDGERPEQLAYRVYGKPTLHWTILLFNEILNPYFDWPSSSVELEKSVSQKYPGRAYFIDLEEASSTQSDFWIQPTSEGSVTTINGYDVTILAWEPNLYKVVVDENSPSVSTIPESLDFFGISQNILYHQRSDGKSFTARVYRIVDDNRYAVHHFEKLDSEEIVDHHFVESIEQVRRDLGINPVYVNADKNKSSNLERYIRGNDLRPMPDGSFVTPIINIDYEIRENDKKRVIKMLRPEFTEFVATELRKIFIG